MDVHAKYNEISLDLNLDSEISFSAWSNYEKTSKKFCLEGNPLHWLACSLTHACWQASVDSVQGEKDPIRGGGLSLNNILRHCEIDFRQYFTLISQWNEMNSVPDAYRVRTDQLKKNFSNTLHMYRKYWEKYRQLFNYANSQGKITKIGGTPLTTGEGRDGGTTNGTGESSQQRKKEKIRCTAKTLYEFCWCLYASIKGEMNENVKDLIMTHNLLMCCLDLIFANCVSEKRYDLINPNFKGLPANWRKNAAASQQHAPPPCILKHLADADDSLYVEMLEMKRYMFRDALRRLISSKTLRVANEEDSEVKVEAGTSSTSTQSNAKKSSPAASAVSQPSSTSTASTTASEFLELLSETNFDHNFRGINKKYDEYVLNNGEIDEKLFLVADNFGVPQHPSQTIGYGNGAGGPENAAGNDSKPPATPLTLATDSARKLSNILGEWHTASPSDRIIGLFKNCKNNPLPFIESLIKRNKKLYMTRVRSDVGNRFNTVVQVAYYLLGNIYEAELSRKSGNVENLLTDENLINSLLACSVEIVNSAYNNPMQFPWILECFELKAFVFYRIIEPVVLNHRDLLTYHVISHLQRIEEQCMESYVWVDGSPVWDLLRDAPLVPTCEASKAHVTLGTVAAGATNGVQRNLFPTAMAGGGGGIDADVVFPELASLHAAIGVAGALGGGGGDGSGPTTPATTPRKRSMTMFFRKFYIQAFKRLETLFKDCQMGEAALLTEVWTIFEHVVVNHLELMRNRHLDQLIMCAVYVYAKAKPHVRNGSFKTIMQKYRNHPHRSSHVYRAVYIGPATEDALKAIQAEEQNNSNPPRPMDDVPGHSVSHQNEIRGDIIEFYNHVYMPKVQQFALRFSNESDRPPMSPVPMQVRPQNTPRKLCNALYVSTQEQQKCDFRSPVEIRLPHSSPMERHDFTQINEMIRAQPAAKKRVLSYEGDDETQIGGTQKLKKMMKDRTENMAK